MPRYELNLLDYWRVIWKRKWIMLLLFLVISGSAWGYTHFQHPIYQATATVRYTRQLHVIFDRFTYRVPRPIGDPMNTQARIARSYVVLRKAADLMSLIKPGMSDEEIASTVSRLQGIVTTEVIEKTDLIRISALYSDPVMATRVASTTAQAYIDVNLAEKSREARYTREFLKERLEEMDEKLTITEKSLSAFKKSFLLACLREKRQLSTETQQTLSQRLNGITQELNETELDLQRLGQDVHLIKTLGTNYLKLTQRLESQEIERAKLLRQYTDKHPEVVYITKEINNLKSELASYESQIRKQPDIEGKQTRLNRELKTTEKLYTDYKQRLEQIKHTPTSSRNEITLTEEIEKYPDLEKEFNRLTRDLEINGGLYKDLKQRYTAASVEAAQVSDVVLVNEATTPHYPIKPDRTRSLLVGILAGLIISLAGGFLIEHLDTSVRTIEEVEDFIKLSVLGTIPHVDQKKNQLVQPRHYPFLVSQIAPKSAPAEAYRALRTALQFVCDQTSQAIIITSAGEKEGKSVTAINCAITLAQAGHKTLLVDGDLRRCVTHRVFGINREPGLTDILEGKIDYSQCLHGLTDFLVSFAKGADIMKTRGLENLYLITAGQRVDQPAELLDSSRLAEFIIKAKQEFKFVIFDTPPILPVTDASIIASRVDAVVMVHRIGKIARGILYRAKSQLENTRTKILGMVLNNLKPSEMESGLPYYYYGRKYYHYSDAK